MKDYYKILGVKRSATFKEIKRSYRKLTLKYHPDKNLGDSKAEERFKEIVTAYETLISKESREAYDKKFFNKRDSDKKRSNRRGSASASSVNYDDFEGKFKDFFGFDPKTKKKTNEKKGDQDPYKTDDLFKNYFGNMKK